MANYRHFVKKPLNRYNSATVRRIAIKFGTVTHFDPLRLIATNNGRHPDMTAVDISLLNIWDAHWRHLANTIEPSVLNATQQGTAPVPCGCRLGCTVWGSTLAPPGEYD